jgi:hypothetical protein
LQSGYAYRILSNNAIRIVRTMDARKYWADYVDSKGGPTKVAEALSIPFQTIAAVCNGTRGIGRNLASRIAAADPSLDKRVLVWVRAIDKAA